jgi:hypothetical protein
MTFQAFSFLSKVSIKDTAKNCSLKFCPPDPLCLASIILYLFYHLVTQEELALPMEVSQRTSATSTVDQLGIAEASTRQSPTQIAVKTSKSASLGHKAEKSGRDDFGGATLTAKEKATSKALLSKESASLDNSSEEDKENSSHRDPSAFDWLRQRFSETINHEDATIPLAWQALLTGLVDALLYTRGLIWTGFQTGMCHSFGLNFFELIFFLAMQATWCNFQRI